MVKQIYIWIKIFQIILMFKKYFAKSNNRFKSAYVKKLKMSNCTQLNNILRLNLSTVPRNTISCATLICVCFFSK